MEMVLIFRPGKSRAYKVWRDVTSVDTEVNAGLGAIIIF